MRERAGRGVVEALLHYRQTYCDIITNIGRALPLSALFTALTPRGHSRTANHLGSERRSPMYGLSFATSERLNLLMEFL